MQSGLRQKGPRISDHDVCVENGDSTFETYVYTLLYLMYMVTVKYIPILPHIPICTVIRVRAITTGKGFFFFFVSLSYTIHVQRRVQPI
jgi:hypothetical protein